MARSHSVKVMVRSAFKDFDYHADAGHLAVVEFSEGRPVKMCAVGHCYRHLLVVASLFAETYGATCEPVVERCEDPSHDLTHVA